MIENERDLRHAQALNVARQMMTAARTAPKGNLQAECVLLIGTREQAQGLNCGHCGFPTCTGRAAGVPCALNTVDVGIAVGSACATAADFRVDTRVMFSAGLAAQRLGMLPEGSKMVLAIPVSASSKNPFFDRKPKEKQ